MSVCWGCVLSLGSFGGIYGFGRARQWFAERQRAKAMDAVLHEEGSADPTDPTPASTPSRRGEAISV